MKSSKVNKPPSKISFEPRAEEDRSISKSRSASNLGQRRIEVSEIGFEPRAEKDRSIVFQKNSKPRSEEDRSISESRCVSNLKRKRIEASLYKTYFRTSSGRGTKSFSTSCGRGREHCFESHAEEWKSHKIIKNSKPRAEEGRNINLSGISNLVRRRKGTLL